MTKQIISVGPRVNESDLGNGFYPQLSSPVALDDSYRRTSKPTQRTISVRLATAQQWLLRAHPILTS